MQLDIRDVEDAFFEAMANGYAQGVQKVEISDLPGSKAITFKSGDYTVMDFYFVNLLSDKSVGQTVIWYQSVPVWTMHYGGCYAKIAIPFLKQCLHRAYVDERRFYGGRGPFFVRDERFTYVNQVRRDSFDNFEGEERVYDLSEQYLGYHWYRGMSLIM